MKIGYIAERSNIKSVAEQRRLLLDDGVLPEYVYEKEHGILEAINACDRGNDTLVVYSAVVIGALAYPKVIKALAARQASLRIIRKDLNINCMNGEGVADGLLDIRQHSEAFGKKIGRKKNFDEEAVQRIIGHVEEGNTQKAAAALYGATETDVSRMVNNTYFTASGRGK